MWCDHPFSQINKPTKTMGEEIRGDWTKFEKWGGVNIGG